MTFPHLHREPRVAATAFIAPNVTIVGDVSIGEGSSVWFGSVVRGDVQSIRIGCNTNIQDLVVVHVSTNGQPTEVGDHVTVGHSAVLHSCKLHDFAFVGFGARVLDAAEIESDGFLAAGAILTPGKIIRSREMWAAIQPGLFECSAMRPSRPTEGSPPGTPTWHPSTSRQPLRAPEPRSRQPSGGGWRAALPLRESSQ